MKTRMILLLVAMSALLLAASWAIAGPARLSLPPDTVELAPLVSKVITTKPKVVPIVGLSIGTGACGTPEHTPAAQVALADLNDITICTSWVPLEGIHLLSIDIFSPGGDFYQKIETPFETPAVAVRYRRAATQVKKVSLEGRRLPVEVRSLSRMLNSDAYLLESTVPVAGSYIAVQAMTGRWTFNVHLDYSEAPVATGTIDIVN